MFLDVLYGNWCNFFPLRPTAEVGIYEGPFGPGRQDLANNQFFDGGGNSSYQDQKRYKPQFYTSLSYFKDGWAGSHDFKFGFDWKQRPAQLLPGSAVRHLLSRPERRGEPGRHLQLAGLAGERRRLQALWISDTWKITDRLTFNLRRPPRALQGRLARAAVLAERRSGARGLERPAPTRRSSRRARSPRRRWPSRRPSRRALGIAYDLTGDNRTVLKAYIGQFRFNSADTVADKQNPVGRAQLRYRFIDLNGNRLLDGPQELNGLRADASAARGFVTVDRDLTRPSSMEVSTSLEREVRARPLGPRVVRLQEHPQRMERDRHGAHWPLHDAVPVQRHRQRRRCRHRRRSHRDLAGSPGQRAIEPRVHQPRRS